MPQSLKSILARKKAVLFDLDGTLINSLNVWNEVDVELFSRLGAPKMPMEQIAKIRETALAKHRADANPYTGYCGELLELFGVADMTADACHDLRYSISREFLRTRVTLREDAEKFVAHLKREGLALAIATTTKRANIDIYAGTNEPIRSRLQLREAFPLILTGEDVSRIKPDPEVFLKAISMLGVTADEALIVEDSIAGVRAANAAGIECITLAERWSEPDREAIREGSLRFFDSYAQMLSEL